MEPVVSIIIPEYPDHTYLIRCINSINRQTYRNTEIILVGTYLAEELPGADEYTILADYGTDKGEGIRQAISAAAGEYIYFCSMTSVITANTLEELMLAEKNENVWTMGNCCIPDGKNFKRCRNMEISLYGRLYKKQKLMEDGLEYPSGCHFAAPIFVLSYLNLFAMTEVNDKIYIYETDTEVFDIEKPERLNDSNVDQILTLFDKASETMRPLATFLLKEIADKCIGLENPYYLIMSISKKFYRNYTWNTWIADNYVKKWYTYFLKYREAGLYQNIRDYLKLYEEEEDYLRVILSTCGLSEELYGYMKKYEAEEFLFYREKLPVITWENINPDILNRKQEKSKTNDSGKFENELRTVEERLDKVLSLIDGLNMSFADINTYIRSVKAAEKPEIIQNSYDVLTGPELADFIIKKYEKGTLGLKTILKSFLAWLKYKFR